VISAWTLRRTLLDLRRQRWSLLGLAGAFALAALLTAGYRLGGGRDLPAPGAARGSATPAQVIAYLREDMERQAIHRLRDVLAQLPGVQHVALVNGEEALVRLRRQLGERARVLDGADDGLLPASLEVWLSPGGDPITRARQLAWRLQRLDGIVDVDVVSEKADDKSEGWVQRLRQGRLVLLLLALLGAGAALIQATAVARRRRRDELRVLLALGFTRGGLLLPAMALAAAMALLGSACGLALAQLGWRVAAGSWALTGGLSALDWGLALVGAGLLGALAGVISAAGPDLVDAR
jgi:cell division protein FtsX